MDKFLTAAIFWAPLYTVPAALGILPALLLLRHRGGAAHKADWAVLYVPFLAWLLVTAFTGVPKSLGNVMELPVLGLGVAAIAAVRWFAGGRGHDKSAAWAFLAVGCAVAVLAGFLVPTLPE